jgi:GxxExxY protein
MDLPFKELTHKIIGCAMEVHRVPGRGFQEYIYQRTMAIELRKVYIHNKLLFPLNPNESEKS